MPTKANATAIARLAPQRAVPPFTAFGIGVPKFRVSPDDWSRARPRRFDPGLAIHPRHRHCLANSAIFERRAR
jgi:hypothetical protein